MLRHVQCTYPRLSWLAVVPVALVLVSCGGSPVGESLTGPSVVAVSPDRVVPDELTLSESARAKTLLCHKGTDQWVPPSAVAGHLRHGDSVGSCAAPNACPCFSEADIQAAGGQCRGTVNPSCSNSSSDTMYLVLACDPGGTVPPGILGIYLTKTAAGGSCSRTDASGTFDQSPLTSQEYEACAAAIEGSGFCF